MKISLTYAFASTTRGNNITAERWKGFFRELGHEVVEDDSDVLIALHARHSHDAIVEFKKNYPDKAVILALTGTDLYHDIYVLENAQQSLQLADWLVVLQDQGLEEVGSELAKKTRVIFQSCPPPKSKPLPRDGCFEVALIGHLRKVKDPFLTADALKFLPAYSNIHVTHVGEALDEEMAWRAEDETIKNPRYSWLGGVTLEESIEVINRANLLVLTSHMEGGANAATEALACGTPFISTEIKGLQGLMGKEFPGFFPLRDANALAELLEKCANNTEFYDELKNFCAKRAYIADPELEKQSWKKLLAEVASRV
ncbi:MAG: selenoneine biosynthesis selenosugar synthase SenB [Planctomycetota bacterium]